MPSYEFKDTHLVSNDIGKTKKITGTRLAGILGLNNWTSPFKIWCDMTKVYVEPFEDSVYTIAGKVIEPKIIDYLKSITTNGIVVGGEEYWGRDFDKRRYDYFPDQPIFGGMWDALVLSSKTNKPKAVIEIKTTKRAEDWQDEIPLYYKIQAMLYARLVGVKTVIFAVSFLDNEIYDDPNKFVASSDTVKVISFRLDEEEIDTYMSAALDWHDKYIKGGISPDFDEKIDLEILKELRTKKVDLNEEPTSVQELLKIIDTLKPQIEALGEKQKVLKKTEDALKQYLLTQLGENDTRARVESENYVVELTKTVKDTEKFDEDTFKNEHFDLYRKYLVGDTKETIRQYIKVKNKEEEK